MNEKSGFYTNEGADVKEADTGAAFMQGRQREERRLVRKLDAVILPLTALLYLSAYLDRGVVGNAKLLGLYDGLLHKNAQTYSLVLSCFYITYIVFSIPGTLAGKAFKPSLVIAFGAIVWSVATASTAGAHNLASIYVCRLFIGVGEACFGQTTTFYYSLWYKKDEISKRLALFIGAGVVAGAFSGLISYGVAHIKNPKLQAWRVLFLIEGLPSLLLAVCILLFLPSRPQLSRYLSKDEKELAYNRLTVDAQGSETPLGIHWPGVKRALTDWRTGVIALAYSCLNLTLASVTGFLPTIIKNLGYTNANAQLFSVPPYAVTLVAMYLFSFASDKARVRGPFVAGVFLLSLTGWSILISVLHNYHARYFAVFLIVIGGAVLQYSSEIRLISFTVLNEQLVMSWTSNNAPNESQRAVMLAMLNCIGQCFSVLASYSFPAQEGPRFVRGCSLNIAFNCLGLCIALAVSLYYKRENARRDVKEGGRLSKDTPLEVFEKFDLAPGYRYTI